jgi:hypothetical protein
MSIPFSNFASNTTTRNNAALTIAIGLNYVLWPNNVMAGTKQATQVQAVVAWVVPAVAVPAGIVNQITNMLNPRWLAVREAERRVYVNAVLENVAVMAGLPANGRIMQEPSAASDGLISGTGGAGFTAGAQIGNGRPDYIFADPINNGPLWGNSFVIEVKDNLGPNSDNGQWQLAAEMATTNQLTAVPRRYRTGILTDGRMWRFYQLDTQLGQLQRTAALNLGIVGHRTAIVRTIYKFFNTYSNDVNKL